jgi:hypothetical protein
LSVRVTVRTLRTGYTKLFADKTEEAEVMVQQLLESLAKFLKEKDTDFHRMRTWDTKKKVKMG